MYVIPELIPDSPAEPWAAHDPNAHVIPALVMPFRPSEHEEAEWHDDALWKAGVRLSTFFADPTQPTVSATAPPQQSRYAAQYPWTHPITSPPPPPPPFPFMVGAAPFLQKQIRIERSSVHTGSWFV